MQTDPIRAVTEADLPILQSIEIRAGLPFAEIGMIEVAEDDPPELETLRAFAAAGRAWAWPGPDGVPVAYLVLAVVDGQAHIEQVSVDPAYAGRRIGKRLLDRAARWALAHGCAALTLTTFTDVPWNGPYYERLGFAYLAPDRETPGLRAIRATETGHGLDRWPRACMRAELSEWRWS